MLKLVHRKPFLNHLENHVILNLQNLYNYLEYTYVLTYVLNIENTFLNI